MKHCFWCCADIKKGKNFCSDKCELKYLVEAIHRINFVLKNMKKERKKIHKKS